MYDSSDPSTLSNMFSSLWSFNSNKKGVIYNLKEKPSDKTLDEIIDFYEKHNVLLIESDKTETKQMAF